SLIHTFTDRNAPDELRLRLYESIREYAAEKLGDDESTTERYIAYFAGVGQRWAHEANAVGNASVERRLTLEFENLMAAPRFTLSGRTGADWSCQGVYARTLALDWVLALRGPVALHLPLLDEALAVGASSPGSHVALRARMSVLRGVARRARGMLTEAWSDFE